MRNPFRRPGRWVPHLDWLESRDLLSAVLDVSLHHVAARAAEVGSESETQRSPDDGRDQPVSQPLVGAVPDREEVYSVSVPDRSAEAPGLRIKTTAVPSDPVGRDVVLPIRTDHDITAQGFHAVAFPGMREQAPDQDHNPELASETDRPGGSSFLFAPNAGPPITFARIASEAQVPVISPAISSLPTVSPSASLAGWELGGHTGLLHQFVGNTSAGQLEVGLAVVATIWPGFPSTRGLPAAPVPQTPKVEGPEAALPAPPPTSLQPEPDQPPPSPSGADLITDFSPFDSAALERSLAHVLDQFEALGLPLPDQISQAPRFVPIAVAILLLEAARRWRKRRKNQGKSGIWKPRSSVLRGFL